MKAADPPIRTDPHKSPRCMNTEGTTTRESSSVINTENNPPVHQPRERACACRDCGVRVTGRRVEPRTMTWNPSGLCDRHEAQQAVRPPPRSTPDTPRVIGVIWLVVHKAPNRRNRRHVRRRTAGPTFYIPKAQQQPAVNRPVVRKKATA